MPRSKRDKEVSLTKVKKNRKALKESLIGDVRESIKQFKTLFVFSVDNMRNAKLKTLRNDFKEDSRFFFGKNKVMGLALGRIPEEEVQENLHKISRRLVGQCGIMFTNRPWESVVKYFKTFSEPDFARSGNEAPETFTIPSGPLPQFPFSLEPQLRKLGLPTALKKGELSLLEDYTVCKEGEELTPEAAKILKLFEKKMTSFSLNLICFWNKDGTFKLLQKKSKKQDSEKPVKNVEMG